jgi:peptide deformylase
MAILKIARMGHPVLLRRAEPVPDPRAPEIRQLVADMIETMVDAGGAGLAAPQVHVPLRLFVFRVPAHRATGDADDLASDTQVLINPTLDLLGDDIRPRWEGCLSIPGMRAAVPRHWRVRYAGFHANVVQHEYDHLEGILYPMRVVDFASFGFNEELDRVAQMAAAAAEARP